MRSRAPILLLALLAASPLVAGLAEGGVIEGVVLFRRDWVSTREAVVGASVTLEGPGKQVVVAETGENGRFEFAGLAPGTYHLSVIGNCLWCSSAEIPIVVEAGTTTTLEVVIQQWTTPPGPKRLAPCEAAATMDADDLELSKRVLSNLGLDPPWPSDLSPLFDRLAVRMVEAPDTTHGPESVVSVYLVGDHRRKTRSVVVRSVEAQQEIHTANAFKHRSGSWRKVPKRPIVVPVDQHSAPLDRELGEQLADLFTAAVLDASYQDKGGRRGYPIHGTTYEFLASEVVGAGVGCGKVYEPELDSPTHLLARIGMGLRNFAKAADHKRPQIEAQLRELIAQAEEYFGQASE